jgi:hypothetical protein
LHSASRQPEPSGGPLLASDLVSRRAIVLLIEQGQQDVDLAARGGLDQASRGSRSDAGERGPFIASRRANLVVA